MVSKQSKAKQAQLYEQKPVIPVCMNCNHYKSKFVEIFDNWGSYSIEKEILCGIGGFAIKKMATCNLYEKKG